VASFDDLTAGAAADLAESTAALFLNLADAPRGFSRSFAKFPCAFADDPSDLTHLGGLSFDEAGAFADQLQTLLGLLEDAGFGRCCGCRRGYSERCG